MSDVLIISRKSPAATRLLEVLVMRGYTVATADDLVSALPELYLSPESMRVFMDEEAGGAGSATAGALQLAAADPGLLGRHTYAVLELDSTDNPATP